MNKTIVGAVVSWLFLATCYLLPATAIELSLEENKGEKGTIGFVDMERVFREYPETKRAKEQFEAEVNNKRLELSRRKADLVDARAELARLQVERERALREGLTEPAVVPAPPAPLPPAVSTTTLLPGATTQTAPTPGLLQSLPGLSPGSAPSVSTTPVAASTAAVAAVPPQPPAAAPAPAAVSAAQRVREVEDRITAKQKEIEDKERAYKVFEAKSETDLIELEKHRVQLLLGKLYDIVQDVAKEEGVSVVVDKKAILFGQKAVDLTDKLIEKVK